MHMCHAGARSLGLEPTVDSTERNSSCACATQPKLHSPTMCEVTACRPQLAAPLGLNPVLVNLSPFLQVLFARVVSLPVSLLKETSSTSTKGGRVAAGTGSSAAATLPCVGHSIQRRLVYMLRRMCLLRTPAIDPAAAPWSRGRLSVADCAVCAPRQNIRTPGMTPSSALPLTLSSRRLAGSVGSAPDSWLLEISCIQTEAPPCCMCHRNLVPKFKKACCPWLAAVL